MTFSKTDTKMMKGITICLMICHHLFTFPDRLVGVSFLSLPFISNLSFAAYTGQFGKICVALFSLLGGYGTYISVKNSTNETEKIVKRLITLYRNFWKVFVLAVPISLLLGMPKPEHFVSDLIYSFLGLRFTYCDEWWFLTPFATLLIAFPLIRRFVDRKNAFLGTDVFILALFTAFIYYILPLIMKQGVLAVFEESVLWNSLYVTATLFPAFAMGCFLAKYDLLSLVKKECFGKVGWILVALVVSGGIFLIHPYNWVGYDFINASLFVPCALILMNTRLLRPLGKVLVALGEESTSMWLLHTLFCYHWCQKLVYAPKYSILIFLWLLILSYAAARLLRFIYVRVIGDG